LLDNPLDVFVSGANFAASKRFSRGKMNQRRVLLAVTGGIAAYKAPELVRALTRAGCVVRCAMTPAAHEFVTPLVLQTLSGESVVTELFDLTQESEIGHIALADWAELLIVAPATANTIAKLAHGLADDPVSTLALATRAPILLAPAMNVNMWRHAATQQNLEVLRARGVRCIGPDSGELACGWDGEGRMSDPVAIADAAALALGSEGLAGEVVLVTAGGTREAVDAVRYLGNRSSGKMGFAIAREAARRGAEVILVAGPSAVETPSGVRRVDVESASEMRDAVFAELDRATIVVKAAAVADFRPAEASPRKIKKEDLPDGKGVTLELVQNADILAEVCRAKGDRIVVGFAAESHDLVEAARRKLARKGCDLMVANDITRQGAGFDADDNVVVFVWPAGEIEELPPMSKSDVAAQLLDRMEKLRAGKG
jgi:phosphopantothenoylcysteine decarboxylase/phosphopantothenate--cysteine ligase